MIHLCLDSTCSLNPVGPGVYLAQQKNFSFFFQLFLNIGNANTSKLTIGKGRIGPFYPYFWGL